MTQKISAHDYYFKQIMSYPFAAKAFFTQHLPKNIIKHVDLDHLLPIKEHFVDKHLKLLMTDMTYKTTFNDKEGYLYLLVEHQSRAEKLMPFRLLQYTFRVMEHHLNHSKKRQLPLVYPLVFYQGKQRYPYSTDIADLIDAPTALIEQVLFKPFQLIELNQIPDETLAQQPWAGLMSYLMKHIRSKQLLEELKQWLSEWSILEHVGKPYIIASMSYIIQASNISGETTFKKFIKEQFSKDVGDEVMSLAKIWLEQGKEQGIQQGLQQGMQQGKQKSAEQIACNLLKEGSPLEFIAKVTKLSAEEIRQLKQKQQYH